MPSRPVPPELVAAAEIADMLGLSRQRISQLAASPGFPKPWTELRMGKIWLADDIRDWASRRKSAPTRAKDS